MDGIIVKCAKDTNGDTVFIVEDAWGQVTPRVASGIFLPEVVLEVSAEIEKRRKDGVGGDW